MVLIEKFLHYKYTVKDWFLSFIPKLNADKDRKLNILRIRVALVAGLNPTSHDTS